MPNITIISAFNIRVSLIFPLKRDFEQFEDTNFLGGRGVVKYAFLSLIYDISYIKLCIDILYKIITCEFRKVTLSILTFSEITFKPFTCTLALLSFLLESLFNHIMLDLFNNV